MLVQRGLSSERDILHAEGDLSVLEMGKACRCDIVRTVLGHEHEMGVRHTVSMNHHADALRREDLANTPSDSLSRDDDLSGRVVIDVGEMIDVRSRNDSALARREGPQCHECENRLILVNEADWRSAGDDLAEWTDHQSVKESK